MICCHTLAYPRYRVPAIGNGSPRSNISYSPTGNDASIDYDYRLHFISLQIAQEWDEATLQAERQSKTLSVTMTAPSPSHHILFH